MGGIKITASDKWFSLCVRERSNWTCERCGTYYPEGPGRMGIHTSHYHGRGKWSTRHDPLNGAALCMGCHLYLSAHPHIHEQWQRERLGPWFDALVERANDTKRGRQAKREQKQLSAHYRDQYRQMLAKRAEGETGRIDFTGYL